MKFTSSGLREGTNIKDDFEEESVSNSGGEQKQQASWAVNLLHEKDASFGDTKVNL